jgi:hypothetical protein
MSALATNGPSNEDLPVYPIIDIPVAQLIDLSVLGIQQADDGVCEDTAENRRILRANTLSWQPVWGSDGEDTGLIQAVSPDQQAQRLANTKGSLLLNKKDLNSDYLSGLQLLIEAESPDAASVPAWVLAATREWNRVMIQRDETGKHVAPAIVGAPQRCRQINISGRRCANWQDGRVAQNGLCNVHVRRYSNTAGHNTVVKAHNKLRAAASTAVDILEHIMETATSEPIRLKAATELLDRAGVRGGYEVESKVEIEVKPAGDMVRERLEKLQRGAIERAKLEEERLAAEAEVTIDAEVVEDEPE